MASNNLDIALRIKAELDQAKAQLDQLNKSIGDTGKAAAASTTGTKAQAAALNELLGKIDPTIAKLQKLDAEQAQLSRAKLAGLIDDEGFARFSAAIEKQRSEVGRAGKAIHEFSLNTSQARLEIGRLGKDLATGQYGRLTQSGLTLANYSGLVGKLLSPTGIAIGATVASLGLFSAALIKGYLDEQKFNEALLATGNYAGVTEASLQQLASNLGSSSGNFSEAHDAVLALAQSGRFAGEELGVAAQAAVNMAQLTGESIDKAVAQVVRLQEDPVRAVKALNDQYHFLTASTYEQIQALDDEGRKDQAAALAQQEFSDALASRVQQDIANMAPLERAWRSLNSEIRQGLQLLLEAGSKSIAHQEDVYYEKRGEIQDTPFPNAYQYVDGKAFKGKQAALDYIDKQIAALKELGEAQDSNAKTQSDDSKEQAAGVAAVDRLHALAKGYNQVADKQLIVKQLNADLDLQYKTTATLPAGVKMAEGGGYDGQGYDFLLKKALGESEKARKPRSNDAAKQAAENSLHEQMVKAINDEQGALDPAAKAWAVYNDAVAKANTVAEKRKVIGKASVETINAERDAYVAAAAKVRDADLAKIADKDRMAFERLRDSLKGIDGISFGKMIGQLDQLNTYLKKGTISAQEYGDAAGKVLEQSLPKYPTYQGVSAVVGGPFGELEKLDAQKAADEQVYKDRLEALDVWHKKTQDSDAAFHAAELDEAKRHAEALKQIDDARTRVMLAGITSSLAQGASAIKQGFGAQSAAYRASFALQKAAAIAQASVAVYTAVSKAFANGVTPVDRAIDVAQAIGEGLTIIGEIQSISAGFSDGGYTGAGGKYQPKGIVHGEEFVNRREVVAQPGALPFLEDFNRLGMDALALHMPGYAQGGYVSPLDGRSTIQTNSVPRARLPQLAANDGGQGRPTVSLRTVNIVDPTLVHDAMSSSEGEQVIINAISRNRSTIKQVIR